MTPQQKLVEDLASCARANDGDPSWMVSLITTALERHGYPDVSQYMWDIINAAKWDAMADARAEARSDCACE